MNAKRKVQGITLIELVFTMALFALALNLIVPSGHRTKDVLSTKTAAEELVARIRHARQIALTKAIPVAVCFPISGSVFQTDQGFLLEGETDPKPTEQWKIGQTRTEIAYYSGRWIGPSWQDVSPLKTASGDVNPSTWFQYTTPPSANFIIFTPSGNAISTMKAADNRFRIAVAMGLAGDGATVSSFNAPYTVWISLSGEAGLERGLYQSKQGETNKKESKPIASFAPSTSSSNHAPVVLPIDGQPAGPKAYPNAVNPKTNNGNSIDLESLLTLEVRVKDQDGDPPYFFWETVEVGRLSTNGTSFQAETDYARWGGRFSHSSEIRMNWDQKTRTWVGRATWAPAPEDDGGNRYRLQCTICDRRGGVAKTGFPIDGNYLVTTKEPWVLYKTWNNQNRAELWKMTLDGKQHSIVASFPYQDVEFGQWTPSGSEVILGAPDGIYRVSADGGGLRRLGATGLAGPVDGSCLSPQGDAVYYLGGAAGKKEIRKFAFTNTGEPQSELVIKFNNVNGISDLTAAQFGSGSSSKTILLSSYYYDNKDGGLFGTGLFAKRKRGSGGMAVDPVFGAQVPSSPKSPGSWNGVGQDRKTTYGVYMLNTNDSVGSGVHVLYGNKDGKIHGNYVNYSGGGAAANNSNLTLGAQLWPPLNTGKSDVRHPRYADSERKGIIFISGRGQNGKLYYMPNIGSPTSNTEVVVSPQTHGVDQPSVSRPR